ncbi:MAG TPA: Gfo/Idh/MocA family oxidoreductase [Bryobacterales bacterium]|nr:Gfo/Idh/MocA family oxidoreductase [Bryobacterales bacterium]
MSNGRRFSRRTFLGSAAAGAAAARAAQGGSAPRGAAATTGPNSRVTVGMIAVGARAQELLEAIKHVDGTEIVAVCDAYKGRLERAVQRTGGRAKIVPDYHEILANKDIDVVTVAPPDHWHKKIVVEALQAGKDVYCEKPLTYTVDEGLEIIETARQTGKLVQVGSQGMSSATQQHAKEMIRSGKLGKVTMIRASYNRNTAEGAWIYPIPPDASPATVNWDLFLGPAPKRAFDLARFFRWRCYKDYSGGIATDLFVHLCTTIHFLMDAKAPASVVALGELYRWKESRDVPDALNAILEYPEGFTANLSCTFNNSMSAEGNFQILGTEGSLTIGFTGLNFYAERAVENNRWIVESWPKALEDAYYRDPKVIREELPALHPPKLTQAAETFRETGLEATIVHFQHFFDSVRSRKPTVEDALAGHRAAACAHMVNRSAETRRIVEWDFARDNIKA